MRFVAAFLCCLAAHAAAAPDSVLLYDAKGATAGMDLAVGSSFDVGSVQLNTQGKGLLALFIRQLGQNSSAKITIVGYADSAAAQANDNRQSFGRALEVKASLLTMGFPPEDILQLDGLRTALPYEGATKKGAQRPAFPGLVQVRVDGMAPVASQASDADQAAAAPQAEPTPAPPAANGSGLLALGLGYPDVRARLTLGAGWDVEAKVAVEQGIQVYSGRLYWNAFDVGPFKAELGAEGGYAMFQGVSNLNGSAVILEGFAGLEYPFSRLFGVSFDVGPASIQASSQGASITRYELIYNTALYVYLF
jgi:hypothetical protein